ncbi:hypothetical protein O6H91_18G038600 [Diphasiastrum complanatum]|uniref:Uncharacterized protein n=1 Tax=Diphasiastrum complanatum TaxID=34168 RepID=A0ACC2B033_DIPCM|nr:hypothetical protein O6H91_18G038600 [Diphasiastrum complanatum]
MCITRRFAAAASVLLLLFLQLPSDQSAFSSSWFSSKKKPQVPELEKIPLAVRKSTSFDIDSTEILSNSHGRELVETAKHQTAEHSCWHAAYKSLFLSCRDVLQHEEKKMRMALWFTDCFLRVSGQAPLPSCNADIPVRECVESLNDHTSRILLAFFINSAEMCHHIQSEAFKLETENVVNDLKNSAQMVASRLKNMQRSSEAIFAKSADTIDVQRAMQDEHAALQENVEKMQESIAERIGMLKVYAAEMNEQLEDVTLFQEQLFEQQEKIAHEQKLLADAFAREVVSLVNKADDIEENVVKSLAGQEELLAGQQVALQGMDSLHKLQETAFEESSTSLQAIANESRKNHLEFQKWQKELDSKNKVLLEDSISTLSAQEDFVAKQNVIYKSIEQLVTLYNFFVFEARALITILFYSLAVIIIMMVTVTNETARARIPLYCGLFFIWAVELCLLQYFPSWNCIRPWMRKGYAGLSIFFLFYCFFTYK